MREIKFRGKRIDNGDWVEGYYAIKGKDTDIEKHVICQSELSNGSIDMFYLIDIDVIPETVGQFTGLQDKNGVDIYDGDILPIKIGIQNYSQWTVGEDAELNGFLEWNDKHFCWQISFKQPNKYQVISLNFGWHMGPMLKVIGNIYENPELLS